MISLPGLANNQQLSDDSVVARIAGPGVGDHMSVVYRSLPWQRTDGWIFTGMAVFFIVAGLASGQILGGLAGALFTGGLEASLVWSQRITITPDTVLVRDLFRPTRSASRDDIASMRIRYGFRNSALNFCDADGRVLLSLMGGFPKSLIIDVANVLGVPSPY
jgi:hypothetical protein